MTTTPEREAERAQIVAWSKAGHAVNCIYGLCRCGLAYNPFIDDPLTNAQTYRGDHRSKP